MFGELVGVLGDEAGHLGFDRLREQHTSAAAWK
jgi:hypothetical protein